ncbi:MAG: Ldh family oxidoreductase [Alphaproteobacteria bacterium]|jgi:delta1-piperideine-2-carboxylate reductase|nr:Ldh family oxidoreductase [Alphaproteobacteria bacterium]
MARSGETATLSLEEVDRLTRRCLAAAGADDANAAAVADVVTRAERDRALSHGLFRVPGYCASLASGKVDGTARPEVRRLAPSVVQVDGRDGFAPLALAAGRAPLIERTRAQGVAALAVVRTYHFQALWAEIEPLCEAGLVALACTAYKPVVAPAGATAAFFGTNPLAFGWPRGERAPMVVDMATSAMARGEIQVAARDGHALPAGAGLDRHGRASTDPAAILDGGVQLPFGGYKGSAIAMMVELLGAGLIGERFSFEAGERDVEDGGPARGGEFVLALDPAAFGDAGGRHDHAEAFFARFAELAGGPRLPADRRYAARAETPARGVEVPAALHAELQRLAAGG